MKVCFCYTVPATLEFAVATMKKMIENGIEVDVVSSNESQLSVFASKHNIPCHVVSFNRGYNLWGDLNAFIKLIKLLKSIKPDVVIGATPKAGLLSMLAANLIGVKKRIYHIFGFPFETARGFSRFMLISIERITSFCATHVLPISQSIAAVCLKNNITTENKICKDYALTIGGVDLDRFNPDFVNSDNLRKTLNINDDDIVIGFVGRITKDKGIFDFIHVINEIKNDHIKCLIIGDNDARLPVNDEIIKYLDTNENIIHIKFTDKIEQYYKLMRILLMPSYREGFGNANVEAQAMKVPVVCYSVTGCVDSVQNGVSGFLIPFLNVKELKNAVENLINNDELCFQMGERARQFVSSHFTTAKVAENNLEYILK